MLYKKLGMTGAAIGMLILILDSRSAAQAAADGVNTCIRTVIPSLFPFFLLSGYLTGGLRGGKIIARIYRSPESCGGLLLTGLLGGYPLGARLAAQQCRDGMLTKAQADRLLWFCSQAGPSFLFGIAGMQMGDIRYGWLLWIVQILSALSVAWALPWQAAPESKQQFTKSVSLTVAMQNAITAMASVCGWVIIFSVVIYFLKRWVLWILPEFMQILLSGLLELTSGCLVLGEIDNLTHRFLAAAVMLNFGGLCVMMQTFSVADGLNLRGYIYGKSLQTTFSIFYSLLFQGRIWALIPILCAFSFKNLPYIRKSSSIPAGFGV